MDFDDDFEDYETDIIILDSRCSNAPYGDTETLKQKKELYKNHGIKLDSICSYAPYGNTETLKEKKELYRNHGISIELGHPEKYLINTNEEPAKEEPKYKIVKRHECFECNATFARLNDLIYHLKSVHGSSNIMCKFCNQSYTKRSNLKRHQEYFCPKNKSVQKNNEKLKYGMFADPFICDYCKKTFSHKQSLIVHIKQHIGLDRWYKCNLCDKKYTKNHNLTCHIKSAHLKIKNYTCKVCKRKFAWRWALISHEKSQHSKPAIKTYVSV